MSQTCSLKVFWSLTRFLFLKVAVKIMSLKKDQAPYFEFWKMEMVFCSGICRALFWGAMCQTEGDMYKPNRVNKKTQRVEELKHLFSWEDVYSWQITSDFCSKSWKNHRI